MKPIALTKKELASLYFPNSTPQSASVQLQRWINRNDSLKNELIRAGYMKGQHCYTPLQVELIFRYLGEP